MNENEMLDITKDVAKEIAKDAYGDIGKPVAKQTGELLGLLPRAIKAALSPVEKWILQREYSIEETKKLLEQKLANISPDLIETPEPYIAVPALQYISYCMDNNELRDMYANLLANSMNSVVKNGVHPGFVEIIKQLSPDEAKILKYISVKRIIPTITLRYAHNKGGGVDIISNFSNVGEITDCENPGDVAKYFDNLIRLGLVVDSELASLTDKSHYEPLKSHKEILDYAKEERAKTAGFDKIQFTEGFIKLSAYGSSFCEICLESQNATIFKVSKG